MDAIRVECTAPGFEDNWLEVTAVWSRRELRDLVTLRGAPFRELWQRKVVACHLVTVAGAVIIEPGQVYGQERECDNLDLRLNDFLTGALLDVTGYLLSLGEAPRRLLYAGVVVAAPTQQTTPSQETSPVAP